MDMEELNKELNLIEFLDNYEVEYKVENDKVITDYVDLSYEGIWELPKDIGLLECVLLDLSHNNIKELPISIGDIICKSLYLQSNRIPKSGIKYIDRIENLEIVRIDYSQDLSEIKKLCIVNTRKDKINSLN
jgi:Leucine-rich repeat (LRR) protein